MKSQIEQLKNSKLELETSLTVTNELSATYNLRGRSKPIEVSEVVGEESPLGFTPVVPPAIASGSFNRDHSA